MSWSYKWTSEYWPLGDYKSASVLANASEIYNQLLANGWTHNAACACLGNIAHESGMNPGQWQGGYFEDFSGGFGLGQWTPASKVSEYCGFTTPSIMADGAMQIRFLLSTPEQWSTYYINDDGYSKYYGVQSIYYKSFSDFARGTDSVLNMTSAYMICWERPGAKYAALSARQEYASYYDSYFKGGTKGHHVIVVADGNGRAWASPATAEPGELIRLFQLAGSDADFERWEVVSGGVTIIDNSFTMPDNEVSIVAWFTGEKPPPKPPTKKFSIWLLFKWRK